MALVRSTPSEQPGTQTGLSLSAASSRAAVAEPFALRRPWWGAILLLGVSATAVGWTIWQLRNDAIQTAISESGNIAAVLAGQLARSIQSIDTTLMEIKNSTKDYDFDRPSDFRAAFARESFYESLTRYRNRLPQVFNIALADRDGQVVVSTAGWPTPNINIADRDYFANARVRSDGRLSTSVPINNRVNGTRTIVFARRLEGWGGEFAGVVYASVNSNYFEDIYGSTQSVNNLLFTLVRQDGTILFRHPEGGDSVGSKLSAQPDWLEAIAKRSDGFRVLGRTDGQFRYVSVRGVPSYPLFVNISVRETAALAGWVKRAASIGIGSTALLLCSLYLLIAMRFQVRRLSRSKASLRQTSQQLDAALNNMPQGLAMFDGEQRMVVCNKRFTEMYGLVARQTQPGTKLGAILESRSGVATNAESPDGAAPTDPDFLRRSSCTLEHLSDGRIVSVTRQPMNEDAWLEIHQDITSQKRIEAKLEHMASYDALTGLANRALFLEKSNEVAARAHLGAAQFSMLMLDLDRFKVVNDSLGHAMGDALLRAVAGRLRTIVRENDHVARLGGDEFAILQVTDGDNRQAATVLANRILETLTEPYDLDGRRVVIGTSVGITLAPEDGCNTDALIRNADLALYKAKSEGRNTYRFFESSMQAEARERRELEEDMRRAIARNEFELHYQTIIDLSSRRCCGVEALVRWRHPDRGLILPDQFIALAEESGLIVPLGEWIVRRACSDAARWPADLHVAVNLSPVQFKQTDLLEHIRSAVLDSGLDPSRLEIEITETVLIEQNEENIAVLRKLKALGVSIVLDDFGTGYSSMRYLQNFPIDKIKIDRSFVQSLPSRVDSAAIVCAIAGLARNLDIDTTAEGVETEEQLAFLRSAGCQFAQGYLFGRPVPAAELPFEQVLPMQKPAAAA